MPFRSISLPLSCNIKVLLYSGPALIVPKDPTADATDKPSERRTVAGPPIVIHPTPIFQLETQAGAV